MLRMITDLDPGWLFRIADGPSDGRKDAPDLPGTPGCRTVDLPHDYAIESGYEPDGDPSQGYADRWHKAVYTKYFSIVTMENKRAFLLFDGVMCNAKVYVNGSFAGEQPYGYAPFRLDITGFAAAGGNIVTVTVDNTVRPADRWYSGAGIFRDVKLVVTGDPHILMDGIFIRSEPSGQNARVHMEIRTGGAGTVKAEIISPDGSPAVLEIRGDAGVSYTAEGTCIPDEEGWHAALDFDIAGAQLWDIETPRLYRACCTLYGEDGSPSDASDVSFGVRTIRMDPDKGLFLNGKSIKLKGVNLHHDGGCTGAAVPEAVWRRRLETLRSIGCNSIRCSHNPPSEAFLDLCDSMGFLVIDEAFDKWTWDKGHYFRNFDTWWKHDLEAMILRDRNHPCVFLWSVGNEVEGQGTDPMIERLGMLADYVRQKDPSRPVSFAMEPHCNIAPTLEGCGLVPVSVKVDLTRRMAERVDGICANYQEQWYEAYHAGIPGKWIIGSETYPYFRGDGNDFLAHKEMCPWYDVLKHPYVFGSYVWPGIDYLGESADRSVRGKTAGLLDTAGFIKPSGHFYRSLWTGEPMVYACVSDPSRRYYWNKSMFGHWSWPNVTRGWNFPHAVQTAVEICVYTNCDEVEISVNGGQTSRHRKADHPNGIIRVYKAYFAGRCDIRGFRGGSEVCTDSLRTASSPETAVLRCAQDDGRFTVVECSVLDRDGNPAWDPEEEVRFDVEGPGRLVGTDNGNTEDFIPFGSGCRRTFQGKCIAVVNRSGPVTVTACSARTGRSEIRIGFSPLPTVTGSQRPADPGDLSQGS